MIDAKQKAAVAPAIGFRISENSIYTVEYIRKRLRLTRSCISREIRLGRLTVSRRAGRRWILGKWLLAWIEAGVQKDGSE